MSFLLKVLKNRAIIFSMFLSVIVTFTSFSAFSVNTVGSLSTSFIQFDAKRIANVKQSLKTGQAAKHTKKAYRYLIKKADLALTLINPSVIDKTFFPPSKNKHDYLSLSRYWWPDPKSPNGLPWIRKDGVTNPNTQTDDVDRPRLGRAINAIRLLSLAYYFSDDEKYAQKGVSVINTWFLDEKTKMNPHLTYAQSVPGNPVLRRSGILDGRIIPERVLDAITLFSTSAAWTAQKEAGMNAWLSKYLQWLTTSDLGKAGAQQNNNHGSWYRFQVAALAWYLKDDNLLEQAVIAAQKSLIEQFNDRGAQEHELKRTRGFFYSCFNLQALTRLANIAEKGNLSLWKYQSSDGHNLKLAIDYLLPVTRGEKWLHTSKNLEVSQLAQILGEGVTYNNNSEYQQVLRNILRDLASKKQLSSYQKRVYYEFALLKPHLM